MRAALHSLVLLLAIAGLSFSQSPPIKLKIDANQSDQERLLKALNSSGEEYRMNFSMVESGYDHRIAFALGKTPRTRVTGPRGAVKGGTAEFGPGSVIVYDSTDHELFRVKYQAGWTEKSALRGTAKQIVRRLDTWRREQPRPSATEATSK